MRQRSTFMGKPPNKKKSKGSGSLEYELRFDIDSTAAGSFNRLSLLAANGPAKSIDLTNTYFDTEDFALSDAGCSLRIRQGGEQVLQTLKIPSERHPDKRTRQEFERQVSRTTPHLSAAEMRQLPKHLRRRIGEQKLNPVFATKYTRVTWTIQQGKSTIEVALDRGVVTAGSQQSPISEIELELKSGLVSDVLSLAMELCQRAPLILTAETKSERGARLARNQKPASGRGARSVKLKSRMSPAEAFHLLGEESFAHYFENYSAAGTTPEPEMVHQMRVALRRLWAILWAFRPLCAHEHEKELGNQLKAMNRHLARARSMDVFKESVLPQAIMASQDKELQKRAIAQTEEGAANERRELTRYLKSPEHTQNMLKLEYVLRKLYLDIEQNLSAGPRDLKEFVSGRLAELNTRLRKGHAQIPPPETKAFHHRRLSFKKLRYLTDAFGRLFDEKDIERYIKRVARLQSAYGAVNDAVASTQDIEAVRTALARQGSQSVASDFSQRLATWRSMKLNGDQQHLSKLERKLAAQKVFW